MIVLRYCQCYLYLSTPKSRVIKSWGPSLPATDSFNHLSQLGWFSMYAMLWKEGWGALSSLIHFFFPHNILSVPTITNSVQVSENERSWLRSVFLHLCLKPIPYLSTCLLVIACLLNLSFLTSSSPVACNILKYILFWNFKL